MAVDLGHTRWSCSPNTARAHQLDKAHGWVVVYFHSDCGGDAQLPGGTQPRLVYSKFFWRSAVTALVVRVGKLYGDNKGRISMKKRLVFDVSEVRPLVRVRQTKLYDVIASSSRPVKGESPQALRAAVSEGDYP